MNVDDIYETQIYPDPSYWMYAIRGGHQLRIPSAEHLLLAYPRTRV